MRHLLANLVTYTIAVLLFVGAATFGWLRSSQLTLTTEAALLARHEPAASGDFEWLQLGADSYARNCSNCHGRDGAGWDQYPALHHTAGLLDTDAARRYFIDLHLYGLTSRRYGAPMPPMGHIADVELAALLNYVAARFGDVTDSDRLFVPEDIAARRDQPLRPADVNRRRPATLH